MGDLFEDFMRELEKENYENNGRGRKKRRRRRGIWVQNYKFKKFHSMSYSQIDTSKLACSSYHETRLNEEA